MGELVTGEVAAVVDVEHVGQAAHRPGRVGLVPDRLAQRQGGVHRRRCAQEDCVAADRPGAVVEDRCQPWPCGLAVGAHHQDVEHDVIGLPHRVGQLCLPAEYQLVLVAVGRCALQGEGDHAGIQGPHDVPHHGVGGDRPPPGGADAGDFAVDGGDGRPRLAQCQALDQVGRGRAEGGGSRCPLARLSPVRRSRRRGSGRASAPGSAALHRSRELSARGAPGPRRGA